MLKGEGTRSDDGGTVAPCLRFEYYVPYGTQADVTLGWTLWNHEQKEFFLPLVASVR